MKVLNGLWEILRRFLNLLLLGTVIVIAVPIAIIGVTIEKSIRVDNCKQLLITTEKDNTGKYGRVLISAETT